VEFRPPTRWMWMARRSVSTELRGTVARLGRTWRQSSPARFRTPADGGAMRSACGQRMVGGVELVGTICIGRCQV
jgi:hypothetical protein